MIVTKTAYPHLSALRKLLITITQSAKVQEAKMQSFVETVTRLRSEYLQLHLAKRGAIFSEQDIVNILDNWRDKHEDWMTSSKQQHPSKSDIRRFFAAYQQQFIGSKQLLYECIRYPVWTLGEQDTKRIEEMIEILSAEANREKCYQARQQSMRNSQERVKLRRKASFARQRLTEGRNIYLDYHERGLHQQYWKWPRRKIWLYNQFVQGNLREETNKCFAAFHRAPKAPWRIRRDQ